MSAITNLIKMETDNAADGTGIVKLVDLTKKLLHLDSAKKIPTSLINYVQGQQQSQFGSYPDHKDVAPSAVFLAIFVLIAIAHGSLFTINYMRGHKFWLSFAFCFYATLRWLGFALRIVWAKDILRLHVGIASEVLLVLPIVFLASFNLVLAQRIFTWRHPVFGNNNYFWYLMIALYSVVIAVVIMTIVAGVVPYLYFLSRSHYDMCRNVVKVTSILITLYSLLSLAFVLFTYLLPVSKANREALVYQPFWIKSFSPFYFPKKNAAQEGETVFLERYRNDPRTPKRTIVGGGMDIIDNEDKTEVEELREYEAVGEQKFSLKHNISICIILITSIFVFIGSLFRCIACFMDMVFLNQSWIYDPVVMYVLWGALETICNVLYLVGRVDLRFYRPDRLSKKQRELYTSNFPATNDAKDFGESTNLSSRQSSDTRV
ncbi:hypothetical protein PICMEDRAFT_17820 [Pichia membranifaciens NRRL Y-2026]|uniref:Uncharacterized protein n=1 Tax=Pichia membranifaciens NRRL Y-2026 TaxID=763406 RepID=A0A1E3NGS1_9ASCO|nr:hypothetical protein PICMEDRAFT_17820 [Pichia membranifaciens NRRL Y-2026]ODQ45355.1 hypothetical protein PICMEDRAFT_17820 [Pichia membranifaciens NRRL Y-2026]